MPGFDHGATFSSLSSLNRGVPNTFKILEGVERRKKEGERKLWAQEKVRFHSYGFACSKICVVWESLNSCKVRYKVSADEIFYGKPPQKRKVVYQNLYAFFFSHQLRFWEIFLSISKPLHI
ncbi:hypothetical protein SAY86_019777 [Trapa natans]|uniref:Uncharacterized protein n=1 Tax=Trapa natans TaxID=22666 RepID=A0AAN7LHX1_TRANT|nr:hypothetical protein SAY86_019777 [Trapa natans]